MNIFLEKFWKIFWKKVKKNIFEKNIYKKYFQYPSVIPFWNRETKCKTLALIENWFGAIWKKIFFLIQRGDPLVRKKRFLLRKGVIFQKKNSAFLEVSQICLRMAWGWWSVQILTWPIYQTPLTSSIIFCFTSHPSASCFHHFCLHQWVPPLDDVIVGSSLMVFNLFWTENLQIFKMSCFVTAVLK